MISFELIKNIIISYTPGIIRGTLVILRILGVKI